MDQRYAAICLLALAAEDFDTRWDGFVVESFASGVAENADRLV